MNLTRAAMILATGGLALLPGGCANLGAEKPPEGLPPIVAAPTGERHPGKVVWHDLLTPDPEGARKFYAGLLGWSFERKTPRYEEIRHNGHAIGGMLQLEPHTERKVAAQWLASLSVADAKEAVRRVRKNGGQVINGPEELGRRGRGALVADAQGAQLFLLESATGDPADHDPRMKEWLWDEVWSVELPREEAFYKAVGRYNDVRENGEYAILMNEGRWRMGIRRIKQEAFARRWIPVVRVADPAALLDQVEALGGTVWTRPEGGKKTALVSDPNGALLILQQWDIPGGKGREQS